jgi:DNA-binding transcriptional MocR family regulator
MSIERAKELAFVLYRSRTAENTLVLEDDHSGAISTAPDVTFATWMPERVLHVRSFSKSHGPDLRIGALGGPRALVDRVVARRLLGPGWTSRPIQSMLHALLTDPGSVAVVDAARTEYARRRLALRDELAAAGIRLAAGDGINAWVPVADERDALVHLAAAGIRVAPGAPFLLGDGATPHVRVTVGVLPVESARPVATALAAAAG